MKRTSRKPWFFFAIGAAAALAALALITVIVLDLERANRQARLDADLDARFRLALWRMDAWLGPRIAREQVRPWYEYEPLFPLPIAFSGQFETLSDTAILEPSPLIALESPIFSLHFQIEGDRITSPQLPAPATAEALSQAGVFAASRDQGAIEILRSLLAEAKLNSTRALIALCTDASATVQTPIVWQSEAADRGDASRRGQVAFEQNIAAKQNYVQQLATADTIGSASPTPSVSNFVPIWIGQTETRSPAFLLVREIRLGNRLLHQGIQLDWVALENILTREIDDLFPDARFVPLADQRPTAAPAEDTLASLPIQLIAERPAATVTTSMWSTPRIALLTTWLAVLATLVIIGFTLRAAITLADRRSRFASAVTHELRTPLTTFTMYSDMLASGMTRSDEQRQTYLNTLRDESQRLSRLVENVLSYARVEDRRAQLHRESVDVNDLLATMTVALEQHCTAAECELHIEPSPTPAIATTDRDVVQQIIWNLIDNACKYAPGQAIELAVAATDTTIAITVTDHGPGIPADHAAAIFRPFDRGPRHDGDPTPGIGLGLAIARTLARDMGGDLTFHSCDTGARFTLTLPIA